MIFLFFFSPVPKLALFHIELLLSIVARGVHVKKYIVPQFQMMEWIKCNHLTDRWQQFKSIPTMPEYELGNLLFAILFVVVALFLSTMIHRRA